MPDKRELAPGVFVIQERFSDPTRIKYDILNETEFPLTMTIDLTGSVNLSFSDNKTTAKTEVPSGEQKYGGTVFVIDPTAGWKLSCKFSWTTTRLVPQDTPDEDDGAKDIGVPDATVKPQGPAKTHQPTTPHERDIARYPDDQRTKAHENSHSQRKELEKGVYVIRDQNSNPVSFDFSLENTLPEAIEFTLNISNSTNAKFSDGDIIKTVTIDAETSGPIGNVVIADTTQAWSLSTRYSWKRVPPSQDYVTKKVAEQKQKNQQEVDAYSRTKLSDGDDALPIDALVKECTKAGLAFVDTEFLPVEESIFLENSEFKDPKVPILWRRASDFFGKEMALFVGGISPNDINQGRLSDCWLLCAFAALAETPERVRRLFTLSHDGSTTAEQEVNDGHAYQVRLCRDGEWTLIRLDDFFPCLPMRGPIYSRSSDNELWVLLLEKAFAKWSGCYDMLRGGLSFEALMDLTGCPVEVKEISKSGDESLWQFLTAEDEKNNIMTASVPGEDKWSAVEGRNLGGPGLVSGHAYSVIQAKTTSTGKRLMQLRNPWGEFEWNGDWSDDSPLWTDALKAELGFTADPEDGLFWMSYEDFRKHFTRVSVCHIDSSSGQPWKEGRAKGRVRYSTDDPKTATPKFPFFAFRAPATREAWVSIHQDDERVINAQPYIDLGFVVMKKGNGGDDDEFVCGCGGGWDRDAQKLVRSLDEGDYYVVPFTSGRRRKRDITRGIDAVFEDRAQFSPAFKQMIWEIFRRYDDNMNGSLDYDDLSALLKKCTSEQLTHAEFQSMLVKYDSRDGGLSRDGFTHFLSAKYDDSQMKQFIRGAGYDASYALMDERKFVLSVHSDHATTLEAVDFSDDTYNKAITAWITSDGVPSEFDEGRLVIYQLDRGTAGTTLAVKSNYTNPIIVTMDCSQSQNVDTTAPALAVEKEVLGHTTVVFHHLFPIDLEKNWQWAYKLSIKFPPT